jgi:hypothetical protein
MTEYDLAFQNLTEFEIQYSEFINEDLSETDTRSKILDKLIINVLGWSEFDIEREGWVRVGFFDYEIKTSAFQFVIEAKKNFNEFKLPIKGNEVKIKSIYDGNKEVIDQIRQYVFEKGLSYGVITNGSQFIIGQFSNTQGKDWKEQKCIFFKDLTDIKKNFDKFYDLLSRESVTRYGRLMIVKTSNVAKTIVKDHNNLHLIKFILQNMIKDSNYLGSISFKLPQMTNHSYILECSNLPYITYGILQGKNIFILSSILGGFQIKKRPEMEDVYELFILNERNENIFYSTALVNDFKTSHFLKKLFYKNKTTYKNIEFSDNESDNEDNNSLIDKNIYVGCLYISEFKKWKPYIIKNQDTLNKILFLEKKYNDIL